jgi:branched-chain amino acid transport system substrate-binding protein
VIVAEGIRNAQRLTGKKDITGDEMRRGLESLRITETRFKELGLSGFTPPFSVNCTDHNGHHSAYMQQWDGSKWVQVSDWIEPMKEKVMPLLEAAAADYVSKNQPWPKRTEACDNHRSRGVALYGAVGGRSAWSYQHLLLRADEVIE